MLCDMRLVFPTTRFPQPTFSDPQPGSGWRPTGWSGSSAPIAGRAGKSPVRLW